MQIIQKKLADIVPYANNTKKHDETQIKNVAESIKKYGWVQPIVIDNDGTIVIGHCRALAAERLGIEEVPCVVVSDLTEDEINALRIVDNKTNESPWDFDLLSAELPEIDLSDFEFDFGIEDEEEETEIVEDDDLDENTSYKLEDLFLFNPFSILDGRTGKWQIRKKQWIDLGISSEQGRLENLMHAPESPDYVEGACTNVAPSTSIFDPVLCELAYKWFCNDGGKIYDCFAGGSVRGIVAAKLGYDYHGIDLRQEQIDANVANASELGVCPNWYCDDSLKADKYIEDNSCDMIFSCPPYADLEVYSDDPRDISNMDYEDFCKVYAEIIAIACRKLKQDRFAVFVVGDVRDKKGFYRNFVDYTKKCFNDNGCLTYNEIIKIDPNGTAGMRARSSFRNRKVVKVHQNVLVFYKGNPKNIKNNFAEIEIDEALFDD